MHDTWYLYNTYITSESWHTQSLTMGHDSRTPWLDWLLFFASVTRPTHHLTRLFCCSNPPSHMSYTHSVTGLTFFVFCDTSLFYTIFFFLQLKSPVTHVIHTQNIPLRHYRFTISITIQMYIHTVSIHMHTICTYVNTYNKYNYTNIYTYYKYNYTNIYTHCINTYAHYLHVNTYKCLIYSSTFPSWYITPRQTFVELGELSHISSHTFQKSTTVCR